MSFRRLFFLSTAVLTGFLTAAPASLPPGTKRVLILGDSITHSGQYVTDLETYFVLQNPAKPVTFINTGLFSETVSGLSEENHAGGQFPRPSLFERLDRVLPAVKADLVFACYGMNDGIYLPLEKDRFDAFKDGMKSLHAAVEKNGAKIIHVTPPVYDGKGKNDAYEEVLTKYSAWLMDQKKTGWQVIDIHTPMTAYLKNERKKDPTFALAKDGVHPGELGHWLIAKNIILGLGGSDVSDFADLNALLATHPQGPAIHKLVGKRMAILRDAWLTKTGHKRPGVATGLPIEQAEAQAAEIETQIHSLLNP